MFGLLRAGLRTSIHLLSLMPQLQLRSSILIVPLLVIGLSLLGAGSRPALDSVAGGSPR